MKVVINTCYGGFGLSDKAETMYKEAKGIPQDDPNFYARSDISRDDETLVYIVETLKEQSWGAYAELKVVSIPDGTEYYIHEYDGNESIHEQHESWS